MNKYIDIQNNIAGYQIPAKLCIPTNSQPTNIVIFCHGFGGNKDGSTINNVTQKLIEEGVGTISFDFPNHGEGCTDYSKMTVDNCVSDIRTVRQFLKKEFPNSKISLFASSFGAYVAINYLMDGKKDFEYVLLRCPAIDMKNILKNSLLKDSFTEYKKNGTAKAGRDEKMEVPYSFYEDLSRHEILKKHEKMVQKMLIFHGTADDTAPIEDTEEFVKLNSNVARLIKIPKATHVMDSKTLECITIYLINYMHGRDNSKCNDLEL